MDERYRWQGVARAPLAVTDAVHTAVVQAGAWLERTDMYSNLSTCFVLGMASDDTPAVARALLAAPGFEPTAATRAALAELAAGAPFPEPVPDARGAAPDACATGPCALAAGRPWAPRGDAHEVFATLVLLYPSGDGSVARARPPG